VSIALLSLVRRFIILDLYQTTPNLIAALAGAAVALGIVFWLVSNREEPQEVGAQEGFFEPDNLLQFPFPSLKVKTGSANQTA
jgi:hypothetical protein